MPLTEKNIRNIFIYSVPKFAHYGLNLIALPILTRVLTPADFGIIALAWTFPLIAVNVFTLGITFGAERYFFEYREDSEKMNALIFSSQAFLYLLLIISAVIVFLLKGHISRIIIGDAKYAPAFFWIFLSGYFSHINSFYLRLYQNMEKATTHSIFTFMQPAVSVCASLIFVWYFRMSYMGMAYGSLAGSFIVCLSIFFHFNRDVKKLFSAGVLIDNIKYGIQLVPKSFTGFLNRFFDKYMLNRILSQSVVGVYNIGQTVGNAVGMLMNIVWSSLQPVYYREVFDKGKDGSVAVGRIFTIFAYLTLAPVILLILFAQEVIYILAPPPYYGAIDIIIIIAGGMATQVFGIYCGVQYAYSKKAYWIFPITVAGTIANVAANIVLIPRFGLIGAGVSTVITYLITNGLLTFVGQRLYKIQYEWVTIAALYANIFLAVIAVIYMRNMGYGALLTYFLKVLLLAMFIMIGFKAGIITRLSIGKTVNSLSGFFEKKEVV